MLAGSAAVGLEKGADTGADPGTLLVFFPLPLPSARLKGRERDYIRLGCFMGFSCVEGRGFCSYGEVQVYLRGKGVTVDTQRGSAPDGGGCAYSKQLLHELCIVVLLGI